jgi:hypothetical protein
LLLQTWSINHNYSTILKTLFIFLSINRLLTWGLLLICLSVFSAFAQTDSLQVRVKGKIDTLQSKPFHSPGKAALYAAVMPSAGQAYNRKYWKIPLVFGGIVGFGYAMYFNNNRHLDFKGLYDIKQAIAQGNQTLIDPEPRRSLENTRLNRDYFKRNRDFTVILSILFYGLTIVDASVDAHLKNFDLSEDLKASIVPSGGTLNQTPLNGISLRLDFNSGKSLAKIKY